MDVTRKLAPWLCPLLAATCAFSPMVPFAYAKARRLPIPSNPARDQEELTEPEEGEVPSQAAEPSQHPVAPHHESHVPDLANTERATERSLEEAPAEEELTGLIKGLPRQFGGLTGEYIYTGEVFTNARGGINTAQATQYRGNFDLVVQLDTEKHQLWEGGHFFLYGQTTHGRSISTDFVGDYQLVSNIDSTPRDYFAQVSEYWYRHDWNDRELGLKVGKQDANADFAYADLGGDFINPSFTLVPTVPLPTFPNPALGMAGFARLTERISIGGGVYDGAPHGGQFGFATLGDNGAMSLVQLKIRQLEEDGLPASLRVGLWQHSGDWTEVSANPTPREFNQNYGVWTTFDKLLWAEVDFPESEQGLGVFCQYAWTPQDRNVVDQTYAGGVVYRGWFEGRDDDVCGIGVTSVVFGTPEWQLSGATQETTSEFFYKAYLTESLSLQGDFQYVRKPNGLLRDALVPGVRFEAVF